MNERVTGRLQLLWYGAIAGGVFVTLAGALIAGFPGSTDWFPMVIAIALGAAVFGGTFFIGANIAGTAFESRVQDETQVRGANVEHLTHVDPTGDAEMDAWLERYVWARNLFGALLIPLIILGGLLLFSS